MIELKPVSLKKFIIISLVYVIHCKQPILHKLSKNRNKRQHNHEM